MWATNIFLFANIKRGLYHFGDSCSNVLNKINIISCADLWGINARERLFLFGGFTELCIYIYIDVSFNIKRDFYYLGVVFGIMLYIYIYVSFNIKRGFYYLGDSGNYVYTYIYNVSFNIKRGFYYLGGSFWHYVYMYLLILKEAFIIWGIQGIMYIYICMFQY